MALFLFPLSLLCYYVSMENLSFSLKLFFLLFLWAILQRLMSATRESMYTEYWLTALSQLGQDKSIVRLTDNLDIGSAVAQW